MHKGILLILFQLICSTGLPQQLSFSFGTPFQRTDLDVRWNVTSNQLPPKVWAYHLLPHPFPASLVSNLIRLGGFTARDLVRSNADEVTFQSPNLACLGVSSRLGAIEYRPKQPHYDAIHLAERVPKLNELPALTTNLLTELGISITDIEKRPDGSPEFHFGEPLTVYAVNRTFVTNIAYRSVGCRRAVDGAPVIGSGAGGDCHIEFGENGKPSKIMLSWRNLERHKAYPTAPPQTLIKWIRQGKAVQGMVRMDAEPIDWKTVKSVTITASKLCYYAGGPFNPSDWLMPFAALWATVDTGKGNVDLEIDCPIIDETKTK
jgi:hypothetical protein